MRSSRKGKNPFKKTLGASGSDSTDTQPAIFSFEHMQPKTGFSINCCDDSELSALTKKLFHLRKTKWSELKGSHRHGMGTEKIARANIKPAIPAAVPEDAAILALRYNGKKPIVGYRLGRVFHILFVDHCFKVYPHG